VALAEERAGLSSLVNTAGRVCHQNETSPELAGHTRTMC